MSVVSFPTPPYQNPPINPQYYAPRFFFISDVLLGQTTIITTTVNLDYSIGQLCRLIIPPLFGCRQLNEQEGYVISIPSANQVELDIDSSQNVDLFITSTATTQPQILAVGDVNTGALNSNGSITQTFIPGSFIDISPN
jgi:hypothetical protein